MTKLLLLFILLITASKVYSQNGNGFLVAKKSHSYFVEMNDEVAFVFYSAVQSSNQIYFGKRILILDTLIRESGEYIGRKFNLATVEGQMCLLANANTKKIPKKMELEKAENPQIINSELNESYWFIHYNKVVKDIGTQCPYSWISISDGWDEWNNFTNTELYYRNFELFVDGMLPAYKDSILQIHLGYTKTLNELRTSLPEITAEESIAKLQEFPGGIYQSQYAKVILNEIAEKRPELYFEIAEKSVDHRQQIFRVVSKPAKKTLKNFDTDSPVKKEFVKYKRKQATVAILGASALTIFNVAFYGGIVYLIVH